MTRISGWCMCLAVAVLASLTGGCQSTEAQYKLKDRPTLILVDDPELKLLTPQMADLIANQMAIDLDRKRVLKTTVPRDRLNAFRAKFGAENYRDYAMTPIDEVGREVGAEQVIHVHVESVSLSPAPGVLRPVSLVRVKVIDAVESRRLFPAPVSAVSADGEPIRDVPVRSVLQTPRTQSLTDKTEQALMQELAFVIARDAGRVFYEFWPGDD